MICKIKLISAFSFAGLSIVLIICSFIGFKAAYTDALLWTIQILGAAALVALFTEIACIVIELYQKRNPSIQK